MLMKFFKTLNKLIEGIMWLYLPIILFYWALTLMQLPAVNALRGFLAQVVEPPVLFIENYFRFEFSYGNSSISYTPLVLAGITIIIMGFVAGMLTMTIISFYKWVLKNWNN